MKGVYAVVRNAFADAIQRAFPTVTHQPILALSKFGDYQCNSALALFKQHGKELSLTSPKHTAEVIVSHLSTDVFSKTEVAPQGFVTVNLKAEWIEKELHTVLSSPTIKLDDRPKLNVLVDFSSPNVAKEMHVGHLRSTIIGESLCRILEFCGHQVDRVNHIGDWGTQFGMLIEFMKQEYPDYEQNTPNISDLNEFYRRAKQLFDSDPDFKNRSREAVVALQSGDKYARTLWKSICAISEKEFQKVYDRLGVKLEVFGESFYNDRIPAVIEEVISKGMVTESDGAKCIFTSAGDVPLMVQKSDGGYGYDSTDLASIKYRLCEIKRDLVIYVTDIGQEEHFMKLFDAAKVVGWYNPEKQKCIHAGFGLVQGSDGRKFKTRSGDVVRLVDLLDEARDRALAELKRRNAESTEDDEPSAADEAQLYKAAEAIGYSSVKYFDLRQNRLSDYKFSFDRMLDPKGNTAIYMMYAYARICAIFRKADIDVSKIKPEELKLDHPLERNLGILLLQFPDIIDSIIEDIFLHRLADFMYKISSAFTEFYQNCKVLGIPEQNSRLLLCEATRKVLATSFNLLGITPMEKL